MTVTKTKRHDEHSQSQCLTLITSHLSACTSSHTSAHLPGREEGPCRPAQRLAGNWAHLLIHVCQWAYRAAWPDEAVTHSFPPPAWKASENGKFSEGGQAGWAGAEEGVGGRIRQAVVWTHLPWEKGRKALLPHTLFPSPHTLHTHSFCLSFWTMPHADLLRASAHAAHLLTLPLCTLYSFCSPALLHSSHSAHSPLCLSLYTHLFCLPLFLHISLPLFLHSRFVSPLLTRLALFASFLLFTSPRMRRAHSLRAIAHSSHIASLPAAPPLPRARASASATYAHYLSSPLPAPTTCSTLWDCQFEDALTIHPDRATALHRA